MYQSESLGQGIVEFRKAEEAEQTWEKLSGKNFDGNKEDLSITFCMPGRSAVVINNRIMFKLVSWICF